MSDIWGRFEDLNKDYEKLDEENSQLHAELAAKRSALDIALTDKLLVMKHRDKLKAELADEQMRANSLATLNEGLRAELAAALKGAEEDRQALFKCQAELAAEREAHERTLAASKDNIAWFNALKADYDTALTNVAHLREALVKARDVVAWFAHGYEHEVEFAVEEAVKALAAIDAVLKEI